METSLDRIRFSLLHDRSLSFVARDESRMDGGEPRMTGDCCRPEGSIHRCVRTHSHLYSYIYMALWHSKIIYNQASLSITI
jgi:hypothetical protein